MMRCLPLYNDDDEPLYPDGYLERLSLPALAKEVDFWTAEVARTLGLNGKSCAEAEERGRLAQAELDRRS